MPPAPTGTTGGPEPAAALAEAPASALTIAQIHQLLESGGHHQLARQVHDDLRVVTLEPGTLVFAPAPALGEAVARALSDALFAATGSRSEEGRVGIEWGSTCKFWWSTDS